MSRIALLLVLQIEEERKVCDVCACLNVCVWEREKESDCVCVLACVCMSKRN
jgi:hypothetical protein